MISNSLSRRTFLKLAGVITFLPSTAVWSKSSGIIVNDVHSQLNPTRVSQIIPASSLAELKNVVKTAIADQSKISLCGGRHAAGAQQFGTDTTLIDMSSMNRVLNFDQKAGLLEVESGIHWPELLDYLSTSQKSQSSMWGVAQKQTGADTLTIGGTLSANAHGQGLRFKPFIGDVQSFVLIDAKVSFFL